MEDADDYYYSPRGTVRWPIIEKSQLSAHHININRRVGGLGIVPLGYRRGKEET